MSFRKTIYVTAALSLAALASAGLARAADLPVKAAKPVADIPFFLVIDDRVTFSYIFTGTDPGAFSLKPGGGGFNGNTAKQVYSFTHFDIWGYGTNFFTISMFKSDHNDPAGPCTNAGILSSGVTSLANCAGATEFYGLFRSTFGWNEIFNTKMFSVGPLHNISFEVGGDIEGENNYLAPAKRDAVAGLQFAFDLPYKGYINVTPLAYKEINHNAFNQCGLVLPALVPARPATSTATPTTTSPGRLKSTTSWISASCRRTCSTLRSAAVPAGTDRRVKSRTVALLH